MFIKKLDFLLIKIYTKIRMKMMKGIFGMKPILIAAAEDTELDFLIERLKNKRECSIQGYSFYEGEMYEYPVVIVKTGVGIINASISMTIAVKKYKPTIIVNEGTAGSHSTECDKWDLVIGEKVAMMNSYKTPSAPEEDGINASEWSIYCFGKEKREILADSELVKIAENVKYDYGNVHKGIIASGDMFNREIARINWFHKNFNTICEEMEGIAVYKVANKFNIPVIGFRVISNNEIIGKSYDVDCGMGSQKFTYVFLEKLVSSWKEVK